MAVMGHKAATAASSPQRYSRACAVHQPEAPELPHAPVAASAIVQQISATATQMPTHAQSALLRAVPRPQYMLPAQPRALSKQPY